MIVALVVACDDGATMRNEPPPRQGHRQQELIGQALVYGNFSLQPALGRFRCLLHHHFGLSQEHEEAE